MTLDPISIATIGYVCRGAPRAIPIAVHGYVCLARLRRKTGGGHGARLSLKGDEAEKLYDTDGEMLDAAMALIAIETYYDS